MKLIFRLAAAISLLVFPLSYAQAAVVKIAFTGMVERGSGFLSGVDFSQFVGTVATGNFSFDTTVFVQDKFQDNNNTQSFSSFVTSSLTPGAVSFSVSVGGQSYSIDATGAYASLEVDHPLDPPYIRRNTFGFSAGGIVVDSDGRNLASSACLCDFSNISSFFYAANPNELSSLSFNEPFVGNKGNIIVGFTTAGFTVVPSSISAAVSPVPLPATAWLMLSGIGVLGSAARRRKSLAVQP